MDDTTDTKPFADVVAYLMWRAYDIGAFDGWRLNKDESFAPVPDEIKAERLKNLMEAENTLLDTLQMEPKN